MPKPKARASFIEDKELIRVEFPFDRDLLKAVKSIEGARFVPQNKGGPYWTVPKDMEIARRLRRRFGSDITFSRAMKEWGEAEIEAEETLIKLAMADDGELSVLPDVLPEMFELLKPFQRAGIQYAVTCENPLIADQPGLGKTWEAIGTVFEAGLDWGKHLVIAPKTSLYTTWMSELDRLQPYAIYVAEGHHTHKRDIIQEFLEDEEPGWLVTNPATIQLTRSGKGKEEQIFSRFPELYEVAWDTIILDECHKAGLRDVRTLTARGLLSLSLADGGKKMALSGTPMGGKAINLWPILHWLYPQLFTSKWRWAAQWLHVEQGQYGATIGGVRPEVQSEFDKWITRYMLRRTKGEVYKELPPKQYVPIWVEMGTRQEKQYKEFALAAEVRIEDEKLTATGILAEYTRLKQFAESYSKIEWIDRNPEAPKFKVVPDGFKDAPKLEALEQLLEERGIFDDAQDTEEQVVIFSQFSTVVDWIFNWLTVEKKIDVLKITGAVNQRNRNEAQQEFQGKQGAKVIVMTTTAGGVAITLDMADTVIFMDETWVPDDQEQGEDRIHRVSRIHQVTCYYIRTKGTIEEYIENRVQRKQDVNNVILDLRREGLRAI